MKSDLSAARGILIGLLLMVGFYAVVLIVCALALVISGKV